MAVDDSRTIDFVSVNTDSRRTLSVVGDHLDWIETVDHQLTLQSKLNASLAFVESGEIFEKFPDAIGRPVETQLCSSARLMRKEGSFLSA